MSKGKHRKEQEYRLPIIVLDEHLSHSLADLFKQYGFRVIEASKARKFKGRDEREYVGELLTMNGLFVTGDEKFLAWLEIERVRHAGALFLARSLPIEAQEYLAEVCAVFFRGACRDSRFALRGQVFHAPDSGLTRRMGSRDELLFSWDWLSMVTNETETKR